MNDFYAMLVSKLELARCDQFHWRPEAYKLLADWGRRELKTATMRGVVLGLDWSDFERA